MCKVMSKAVSEGRTMKDPNTDSVTLYNVVIDICEEDETSSIMAHIQTI